MAIHRHYICTCGRTLRARHQRGGAVAVLLCLALLAGCAPSAIRSTHGYVLVRTLDAELVPLPDDDPLYALFERQVLGDTYPHNLLDLCENTTEAFVATDTPNRLSQTVGNYPIIVLDSHAPGVLREVVLHPVGAEVPVELALGLGYGSAIDLQRARQDIARVCGGWLLELVGVSASQGGDDTPLEEPTDASAALRLGLTVALEVLDTEAARPERAARDQSVLSNAYAYRWVDGAPTSERLSRADAVRTPGAAAAFFCRLLQETGPFCPQRYMLWFLNYPVSEMPLAKTVRVCLRLGSAPDLTLDAFISHYAETYPAERSAVLSLAAEVFGE